MRNESMYLTMYNESIQKVSNQEKIIEELKETVEKSGFFRRFKI